MNIKIRRIGKRVELVVNGTRIGQWHAIHNLLNALRKILLDKNQ